MIVLYIDKMTLNLRLFELRFSIEEWWWWWRWFDWWWWIKWLDFCLCSNDDDDDDEDEVIETFRLELSESIEVWDGEDWKSLNDLDCLKDNQPEDGLSLNWTSPIQSGVKI